ncbi:MAG: helix-turn-helix domain-containing protein [Gemmatimonadaceae bacterium]
MDIQSVGSVLEQARKWAGLTQRDLALRAGTSQPAIARLEQGHASPTFATLERLAAAAGFDLRVELVPRLPNDPVVEVYKRAIDRTLLRENLKKSVDERIRTLANLQEFGTEVRRAVREAKRSS